MMKLPMPIMTPRLLIKPRLVQDSTQVFMAIRESIDSLRPWMPWAKVPLSFEEIENSCRRAEENFKLRTDLTFSIFNKEDSKFIGAIGLQDPKWDTRSFNIAYWIDKKFEGRGFASEAVNALTRYSFEVMGARRVAINCAIQNYKSLNVIKKLGFSQEHLLQNHELAFDGSLTDIIMHARYDLNCLAPLEVSWPKLQD